MICLKLLFCIDLRVVVGVVVVKLMVRLELELVISKVCSISVPVECFVSWLVKRLSLRVDVLGP